MNRHRLHAWVRLVLADPLTVVFWTVIAAGIVLRGWLLLARQPLWLDESMVALNILTRSPEQLLAPLDFQQSAPPVWLWIERFSTTILGTGEVALRAPQLLAGSGALLALSVLLRRWVSPVAALTGVILASFAPVLLWYSVEVKPYMADVLVAAVLMVLATMLAKREEPDPHLFRRFGLYVAAAPFLSMPSFFFALGFSAFIFADGWRRQSRPEWRAGIYMALAVIAAQAFLMLTVYEVGAGGAATVRYMKTFWSTQGGFLDPISADFPHRVAKAVQQLVRNLYLGDRWTFPLEVPLLAAITGVGIWTLVRRRSLEFATMVALPLLGLLGAAAIKQYPISARTCLAFVPAMILLLAAGLETLLSFVPARARLALPVLASAMLFVPASTIARVRDAIPYPREDVPAVVRALGTAIDSFPVFLNFDVLPTWLYYRTDWNSIPRKGSPHQRLFFDAQQRGLILPEDSLRARGARLLLPETPGAQEWAVIGKPREERAGRTADRILAQATPCVIGVVVNPSFGHARLLMDSLRARGAPLAPIVRGEKVNAWRLCPAAPAPPDTSSRH